jgi:hypothetical protein
MKRKIRDVQKHAVELETLQRGLARSEDLVMNGMA